MLSLGGLILILLIVAIIPIGYKVKEHARKIRELEGVAKKPGAKK